MPRFLCYALAREVNFWYAGGMNCRGIIANLCWLAVSAGLVGCNDAQQGHATPRAAEQFSELRCIDLPTLAQADIVDPEFMEAYTDAVEHFARTADVTYTAPYSGIGILHMACIFKKAELVRCLLLDGADPNLHLPEDDSPLLLAVGTDLTPQATAQDIISLVDILLAGGADMAKSGREPGDFLTQAAFVCEREEVLLHLLDKGATPDAATALPLALHGWLQALSRVLSARPDTRNLLHAAAVGSCRFEGQFAECIELLLKHGAQVNDAEDGDQPGVTPLFRLAEELSAMPDDSPRRAQALDVFALLLRHGADPYLRAMHEENYPGFCPHDFLSMRPGLLAALQQRGIELPAQPLHFSSGIPLLAEVCRTAATASTATAEELAPHFDSIASLLTPSLEMLRNELYPQALEAAVRLLARTDAPRASRSIQASPLWQKEDAAEARAALLEALRDNPPLALTKDFICTTAEAWEAAHRAEDAAALAELLGRCPDAAAEIDRYCQGASLPLQAGAYAARLSAEGLPDARNNGVVSWLLEKQRKPDTPFLQAAVLLTSLEKLWYGQMPEEEQAAMLRHMRSIGATRAAAAYEEIAAHLDDAAALDAIMQRDDSWKFELETATARFFLAHKNEFLTPAP